MMATLWARARAKVANLRVIDRRHLHALWEQQKLQRVFAHFGVDCVFDIGANEGQYATMLRRKVGFHGLILSFEPDPHVATALRRRAAGDPRWEVAEQVIADRDGEMEFKRMAQSQFSSLANPNHMETDLFRAANTVASTIKVRAEKLSTALDRLKLTHGFERPFLKMDTQGYDVNIVSASPEAMHQFVGLQSELAVKKLYDTSVDYRSAIATYEGLGFELCAFVPNNEGHFPQLIETDCIMFRSDLNTFIDT